MGKTPSAAGKGDKRRPGDDAKYRANWDTIFKRRKPRRAKKPSAKLPQPPTIYMVRG